MDIQKTNNSQYNPVKQTRVSTQNFTSPVQNGNAISDINNDLALVSSSLC